MPERIPRQNHNALGLPPHKKLCKEDHVITEHSYEQRKEKKHDHAPHWHSLIQMQLLPSTQRKLQYFVEILWHDIKSPWTQLTMLSVKYSSAVLAQLIQRPYETRISPVGYVD